MNKKISIFLILILLNSMVVFSSGNSITVTETKAHVGDFVTVPIYLSEGTDINVLEFELEYDDSALSVGSVITNSQFDCIYDYNVSGKIIFIFTSSNKAKEKIELAKINFQVKKTGVNEVSLNLNIKTSCINENNQIINVPLEINNGRIIILEQTIEEQPSETPKASSRPSRSSTATNPTPTPIPSPTVLPSPLPSEEPSNTVTQFEDITEDSSAQYINKLENMGVLKGYIIEGKHVFLPQNEVSRAEFSKIVSIAFNFAPSFQRYFKDEHSWADDYINALANNKIIKGSDGYFYPDSSITRAEVAVILNRILKIKSLETNNFLDIDAIPSWAVDDINTMVELHIMDCYDDNTFKPNETVTRGNISKIMYLALKYEGSVKK